MSKILLPPSVPDRLRFIGVRLYGPTCWRGKLAAGLGVARSTLNLWLRGAYKSTRDIDAEIVDLLDRECDASAARSIELAQLRRCIIKAAAREAA